MAICSKKYQTKGSGTPSPAGTSTDTGSFSLPESVSDCVRTCRLCQIFSFQIPVVCSLLHLLFVSLCIYQIEEITTFTVFHVNPTDSPRRIDRMADVFDKMSFPILGSGQGQQLMRDWFSRITIRSFLLPEILIIPVFLAPGIFDDNTLSDFLFRIDPDKQSCASESRYC